MNFIILKVNGIDVSSSCHEEVMSILNRSKQPVQVEILTKDEETTNECNALKSEPAKDDPKSSEASQSSDPTAASKPDKADKQVQTDSKWLDDLVYQHCLKCQFELNEQTKLNKISLNNKESFYKDSDSDDFYEVLDDSDNYAEELDEDFIDENCDAFEYKELNWSKASATDSIGLILDKLENDKQNLILKTEIIYIKEILNPALQSILRPGDQILEINGIVITNLEDARSRLDNPILNEFNILFSRLNTEHDHKLCEQRINVRKQKVQWLKQNAIRNQNLRVDRHCSVSSRNPVEYDNEKLQSKDTEKDSGLGKQTDQESVYTRTNETCSSSNDYDAFNSPDKHGPAKRSNSSNSLEKEILLLNREMENIKFECEMLSRNFRVEQKLKNPNSSHCTANATDPQSQPTKAGHLTRQLSDLSNNVSAFCNQLEKNDKHQAVEKKESIKKWIKSGLNNLNSKESAVKLNNLVQTVNETNTSRTNAVKFNQNRLSGSKTLGNLIGRAGSMISLNSADYQNSQLDKKCSDCPSEHEYAVINYENTSQMMNRPNRLVNRQSNQIVPPPLPERIQLNSRKNSINLDAEDNELRIATATMYTNKANLHQTILLQQQLLRQAIEKKQLLNSSLPSNANSVPQHSAFKNHHRPSPDNLGRPADQHFKCKKIDKNKYLLNNTVIKLKRKSDGTRYISRKVIVDESEVCQQKIINCNKNLINPGCGDNEKPKKSKDIDCKVKFKENDCKHHLKTKLTKKISRQLKPKEKSNDKLEERLKKMKLKDNHLVLNSDMFTVATV